MSSALLGLAPSSGLVAGSTSAAPLTGGLSLLLPLLAAFGPGILSKLFGNNPQAKMLAEIQRLLDPKNVQNSTNQFYQQAISSPGYSSALQSIAAGANQTSNQVASSLAERGIGTTGTGAVLSGLTPSLVGSQQGKLQAGAHDQAQEMAMNQIKSRIAALTGAQGPSQTQQYLAGGLDAFSPYLQAYLKHKYPVFNSIQPAKVVS